MTPGRRVLVVEDDPRIAQLLLDYLRHDGHDARTLADGQLALAEIRHAAPDLLILDLMLPGLDGVSLCRAVRQFSAVPSWLTAISRLRCQLPFEGSRSASAWRAAMLARYSVSAASVLPCSPRT